MIYVAGTHISDIKKPIEDPYGVCISRIHAIIEGVVNDDIPNRLQMTSAEMGIYHTARYVIRAAYDLAQSKYGRNPFNYKPENELEYLVNKVDDYWNALNDYKAELDKINELDVAA